jgi:hypothetical protein
MSQDVATPAPRSGAGAWWVLGSLFAVSTLLGVVLLYNYSRVLGYVKRTIDEPVAPHPWESNPHTAEQCIDASMAWARDCRGVKSMCDMYVERYVGTCLESQDRTDYCAALGTATDDAHFGVEECRGRGTQKNVDAEACANAYRTVASFCEVVRRQAESTP